MGKEDVKILECQGKAVNIFWFMRKEDDILWIDVNICWLMRKEKLKIRDKYRKEDMDILGLMGKDNVNILWLMRKESKIEDWGGVWNGRYGYFCAHGKRRCENFMTNEKKIEDSRVV